MNLSENNNDKLTPQTTFFTPTTLFALLIKDYFLLIDRHGIAINPALLAFAA